MSIQTLHDRLFENVRQALGIESMSQPGSERTLAN